MSGKNNSVNYVKNVFPRHHLYQTFILYQK